MMRIRLWLGIVFVVAIAGGMLACSTDTTKPRYIPPEDSTSQNDSTKQQG